MKGDRGVPGERGDRGISGKSGLPGERGGQGSDVGIFLFPNCLSVSIEAV